MKRSRRILVPLLAVLLGSWGAPLQADYSGMKRLVLHGVDCETAEDCAEARAVVDEAIQILRDDMGEFAVVTASASLVRSRIVAAGIAPERIRMHGSEMSECIAALSTLPCQ